MTEINIKVGDVVQLKSGGPKMTVDSVGKHKGFNGHQDDYTSAICIWLADNKKYIEKFQLHVLEVCE